MALRTVTDTILPTAIVAFVGQDRKKAINANLLDEDVFPDKPSIGTDRSSRVLHTAGPLRSVSVMMLLLS